MTKEEIMKLIEEDVSVDIYGGLHGHDRVAEIIARYIMCLNADIERLRDTNSEMGWRLNPDRMGGQFTEEEKNRSGWL